MTIKVLLTIVTRGILRDVTEVMQRHNLEVQFATLGHGTATSEIRDMLGLGTTEKDVVITLVPQQKLRRVLPDLYSQLHLGRAGHGIAFAITLDGINATALNSLVSSMPEDATKEESSMNKEYTHEVILSVLDGDVTDLAFAAAKEAGCRGGTVIKGRQLSADQAKKIFSLTVQPEKELLMILVPEKDSKAVMKAMVNKVKAETGEIILAFSLPVSDVVGLSNYDLMNNEEEEN